MMQLMLCNCQNEFQDATYGKFRRQHNWALKCSAWRCTVCGKERKSSTQEK